MGPRLPFPDVLYRYTDFGYASVEGCQSCMTGSDVVISISRSADDSVKEV